MELTIVMPCLNEAETIATCIRQARAFLESEEIVGEIVIADNGSTDGSQKIAIDLGARVIDVAEKGYGAAITGGIEAAQGTFIAMGDADDSYDFGTLGPFVKLLREGADLVMGNRFSGGIQPGAMPLLHRLIGNPVLSFIGRLFFKVKIKDFHCGLRAFRRDSILQLGLCTTGMEFASEMIVKSAISNLKISEVPTTLKKDGRSRPPHLRSFRDGWRHLRFLLLFSPRWVFLYPGVIAFTLGVFTTAALFFGPINIGSVRFDLATLIYSSALAFIGFQGIMFSVLARTYANSVGLISNPKMDSLEKNSRIETGIVAGVVIVIIGVAISLFSLNFWSNENYGQLDPSEIVRIAVPGALGLTLGFQILFFGTFASLLKIHRQ